MKLQNATRQTREPLPGKGSSLILADHQIAQISDENETRIFRKGTKTVFFWC